MKKSDHARSRKAPVTSIDGASAATLPPPMSKKKNLSLIFSKLAEFEDQRLDEDFFRIIGDDTDFIIPVADFSAEVAAVNEAITCNLDNVEKLRRLHDIFQKKLDKVKELELSTPPALSSCRATHKTKDLMILDYLRLKQNIETLQASYQEKADLCRNLQARNKEYEATSQLLLKEERHKTEELRAQCIDSIDSITKQIEDEEAAVSAKKEENASLGVKITEFNGHLVIRDEHLVTQRKARVIEQQLLEAKKVQYARAEEQRASNSKSYQIHIQQLLEAQRDLERQVGLYMEKASSFEATLDDTRSVFQQFEDRVAVMLREVSEEEDKISEQRALIAEKDKKLLKMSIYIISANRRIEEMDADHSLAEKCRELQARRTELTNKLAGINRLQSLGIDTDAADGVYTSNMGHEDLLDDRPSEEVADIRSGRTSPHLADTSWTPSIQGSSSSRACSTPSSSSSRNWTETATKETTAGEDTPVSSPSVHSPKRLTDDIK